MQHENHMVEIKTTEYVYYTYYDRSILGVVKATVLRTNKCLVFVYIVEAFAQFFFQCLTDQI
jgi:hypothetical protein